MLRALANCESSALLTNVVKVESLAALWLKNPVLVTCVDVNSLIFKVGARGAISSSVLAVILIIRYPICSLSASI